MTTPRSNIQRCPPLVVGPVDVAVTSYERPDDVQVSSPGRYQQGALTALVRSVHVTVCPDQHLDGRGVSAVRSRTHGGGAVVVGDVQLRSTDHQQLDDGRMTVPHGHVQQTVALCVNLVHIGPVLDEQSADVLEAFDHGNLQRTLAVVVEVDVEVGRDELAYGRQLVVRDSLVEAPDRSSLGTLLIVLGLLICSKNNMHLSA